MNEDFRQKLNRSFSTPGYTDSLQEEIVRESCKIYGRRITGFACTHLEKLKKLRSWTKIYDELKSNSTKARSWRIARRMFEAFVFIASEANTAAVREAVGEFLASESAARTVEKNFE